MIKGCRPPKSSLQGATCPDILVFENKRKSIEIKGVEFVIFSVFIKKYWGANFKPPPLVQNRVKEYVCSTMQLHMIEIVRIQ